MFSIRYRVKPTNHLQRCRECNDRFYKGDIQVLVLCDVFRSTSFWVYLHPKCLANYLIEEYKEFMYSHFNITPNEKWMQNIHKIIVQRKI